MIAIQYKDVSKRFGSSVAVNHVSADIEEGEFITILGSSGCGKTTLLKMTNRLYECDEGSIHILGSDISKKDPVQLRRSIGYVIQQVGLFPHMTIAENIATVPNLLGWSASVTEKRIDELLTLVGLDDPSFKDRYPSSLSGGQQQRIGLARAMAADPKVMLLDEPFGAIDAITRLNLQNELKRIHAQSKKTYLFVTHDINEAFKLGTRVMIMNEGKLVQFDTPKEIVRHPSDAFVKELIDSAREQNDYWETGR